MADALTIKRNITVQAVVTPTWKQEAERELSQGCLLYTSDAADD